MLPRSWTAILVRKIQIEDRSGSRTNLRRHHQEGLLLGVKRTESRRTVLGGEQFMGLLIGGHWHREDQLQGDDGEFHHQPSQILNWITPDGSCGPSGDGGFAADAGRYHLYVSLACENAGAIIPH